MTTEEPHVPIIFIVDDDPSIRRALGNLVQSVGLRAETFASAAEFLAAPHPDVSACLILDVRLPGLGGLDVQTQFAASTPAIPIIFLTGHGDIPMTVRAMRAGAVEFLTKPFREQDMLDAIKLALDRSDASRRGSKLDSELRRKLGNLSAREQEVMAWVTGGLLNKQVAAEMGVSEITVKVHRGKAMRKMGARSLAELVRMADLLGVRRTRS